MSGIPSTKPLMEGYEAENGAQNPYPSGDVVRWRAWYEGQQMAAEHREVEFRWQTVPATHHRMGILSDSCQDCGLTAQAIEELGARQCVPTPQEPRHYAVLSAVISDPEPLGVQIGALCGLGALDHSYQLPNGQKIHDWRALAEQQRQAGIALIKRMQAKAENVIPREAQVEIWRRWVENAAKVQPITPQPPPAPHPNAAHAAPVSCALNRSRKQQTASSWDRAIWQPEDGRG